MSGSSSTTRIPVFVFIGHSLLGKGAPEHPDGDPFDGMTEIAAFSISSIDRASGDVGDGFKRRADHCAGAAGRTRHRASARLDDHLEHISATLNRVHDPGLDRVRSLGFLFLVCRDLLVPLLAYSS